MSQTLVIQEKFYNSLKKKDNLDILKNAGYNNPIEFLNAIIKKLNDEFSYLEITGYRFQLTSEIPLYSQYGAFIEGETIPYKKVIIFFTPID